MPIQIVVKLKLRSIFWIMTRPLLEIVAGDLPGLLLGLEVAALDHSGDKGLRPPIRSTATAASSLPWRAKPRSSVSRGSLSAAAGCAATGNEPIAAALRDRGQLHQLV